MMQRGEVDYDAGRRKKFNGCFYLFLENLDPFEPIVTVVFFLLMMTLFRST